MNQQTIYLAADHAGLALKERVKELLEEKGYEVEDFGAYELNPEDDYPDFIHLAADAVARDPEHARAIIFGGSGQGEAMVANRYPLVRATVYYGGPLELVKLSRSHNGANILSIGARFVTESDALKAVETWLPIGGPEVERHIRRIQKIERG